MQANNFLKYQQELSQFTLLQGFNENDLHDLAEAFTEKTLQIGEYLFHEHDSSSEVYFIRSGKIEVTREPTDNSASQVLAILESGQEVGELAVIDGSPRSASAHATEETRLFVMSLEHLPVNLMLRSRLLTNTTLAGTQKLRQIKQVPTQAKVEQVDSQILLELQQYSLLNGLSKAELIILAQILEIKTMQVGEYLFKEYEKSSEVYFIRSGKIDICKSDSSGTEQVIATLGEKQEVGELTLLDGAPRSASAKVTKSGEILVLNTKNLPNNMTLLSHLINNITLASTDKLRQTNAEHVRSLERELQIVRTQNEFGHFFVYGLGLLAFSTIFNYLLSNYLKSIDIYSDAFGWGYLMVVFIPSLILVSIMKIPFNSLGVTWNNWQKSVKEATLASIICIAVFLIVIGGGRYLGLLPEKTLRWGYLITIPLYFIHSYIQEFIARGIIQSSFQRFFNDEVGIKSVILASFFFALFHIYFGLGAVFVIFISGLMFGALYVRHNNLLGVTIFHVVIGTCALISGLV